MKWAIALSCGHGCMLWNGEAFTNSEADAAKFAKKEWAEKALKTYSEGFPLDSDFDSRLYVQAVCA